MRKAFLSLLTFLMCLTVIFALASCGKDVEFKVNFVVDGEIYSTINTSGDEIIKMPENPTKEGYAFDGWYWDKDEWKKPFTANSLLDAPLSSDMNVYAKWAHIHISSDWIVDKDATCKEAGSKHKECIDCEEVLETASIDKLTTHTPGEAVIENFVDSDCETEGSYNLVVYCSVCREKLSSEAKVVEKKPHTPSDWKIDKNATCKEAGAKHKECTKCEEVLETASIDKLTTHTLGEAVVENFVDSTCKTAGSYNSVVYCSVCEEKLSSEAKTIEKKPHTEVVDQAVEPTCTTTGLTEGKHCSECDTVIVEQTVVKMLDHEYSDELSYNATHHFYECECGHKNDETRHTSSGAATATTDEVCTVCGYVITNAVGISFKTLTVDGNNVYGKVSNDTTFYSFINEIVATGGAKYVVSTNISGTNVLPNKTIDLNIGDNTVYITEYINDEPTAVYTVVIRRRAICEVQFSANGGTSVLTQYVEEDSFATEPQTSRAGYTFAGWNYDFAKPITRNTVISASWNPNENTKYEVWYYLQNIDGSYPSTPSIDKLTGTTDTIATAEQKNFPHFTFNEVKSITSGNIDGDGSLVLTVYYTRDTYTISTSVSDAKGGGVTAGGTYPYGSEITLSVIVNAGYTFGGYKIGDNIVCNTENYSFTVSEDAVFVVDVTANTNTKYIVEYYLSNIESGYTMVESVELYGTTDTTAIANQKTFDHFTFDSNKSIMRGNIDGNGSLVLEVYYTRDKYIVTSSVNNSLSGGVTNGGEYKYDTAITLTATTNPGYTFLGWFEGETMICETLSYTFNVHHSATYEAKWKANENTKYEVWHFLQNIDGSYSVEPSYVERFKGTTDTEITVQANSYNHFTFDANNSVVSGNINGDGCAVLKVYYTRNTYTVSLNDSYIGAITNAGEYVYTEGSELTLKASVLRIGYSFDGWYSEGKLVSVADEITIAIDRNIEARFSVSVEMQNFNFTSTATTCEITGLKDETVSEIVIPDYVTSIASSAFKNCTGLTSITIPFTGASPDASGYKSHFGYIFGFKTSNYYEGGCHYEVTGTYNSTYYTYFIPSSLKNVVISESATKIGSSVFSGCRSLTSLTIPGSVTSIGESALNGCVGLESITLPFIGARSDAWGYSSHFGYIFGYKRYSSRPDVSFNYSDGTYYYAYNIPSNLKNVTISDGVTNIGYSAFSYCSSLTSITIPDSITSIDTSAFSGCASLESITIPDMVTSIGSYAFSGCTNLKSVIIGDSVTTIGSSAFSGCASLTSVHITDIAKWCGISFADSYSNPLYYAEKLYINGELVTEVVVPNDITSIGVCAFSHCSSLISITIPDSVTSIATSAFRGCTSLASIKVVEANTVYKDVDGNLYSKDGKILIQYAIGKADTSFTIPEGVTTIGSHAFSGCTNLKSVIIGDSVTTIGSYAFFGCTNLKSVIIGDSVTTIGSYAFSACTSLEEISFNASAMNNLSYSSCIFSDAGKNGNGIKVVIGANVTKIPAYLFYQDSDSSRSPKLLSVEFEEGSVCESIGYRAFYSSSINTSVTVPNSVTRIDSEAFGNILMIYCEAESKPSGWNYNWNISSCPIVWNCNNNDRADDGYIYTVITGIRYGIVGNGTAFVAEQSQNITVADIPSSIVYKGNTYKVKSICDYAFRECDSLTSVVIPDSVTSIGKYAFGWCTTLTSVTIGNGVSSIGSYAFYGCDSLTIYCEATSKPSGWTSNWNDSNCPVVWGYKETD